MSENQENIKIIPNFENNSKNSENDGKLQGKLVCGTFSRRKR
jgi:hypothetical protein